MPPRPGPLLAATLVRTSRAMQVALEVARELEEEKRKAREAGTKNVATSEPRRGSSRGR